MVTSYCDGCGALVFFESVTCVACGRALGFLPDVMSMAALEPAGDVWQSLAEGSRGRLYRPCANGRDFGVCNWYVPVEETVDLCAACRLNEMIPDTSVPDNRERWHRAEIAKRRLVYTLLRLGLPSGDGVDGVAAPARPPLRIRFLADVPGEAPVMTGHANGVITLNIAEADDAERERRRVQLFEPQRTLVGHFRHESGHYYWSVLIAESPWHERVRALFGDERADYAAALSAYYANGPSPTWADECVSAYASAHPWEDWAETWAHLLHMLDSLETAAGFGLSVSASDPHASAGMLSADPLKAVAAGATFDAVLDNWFPLTFALNSLNRGLGLPDLYPYVLSAKAIEKLRLVHEVISAARAEPVGGSASLTAASPPGETGP